MLESFITRKEAQLLMRIYLKFVMALGVLVASATAFKNSLQDNKENLIQILNKYQIPIDTKLVLSLLKIPISFFYYWKNQVQYKCETSPLKLCKRIYPLQLTAHEVSVLKELVSSERFKYWPICSLAWYAARENLL